MSVVFEHDFLREGPKRWWIIGDFTTSVTRSIVFQGQHTFSASFGFTMHEWWDNLKTWMPHSQTHFQQWQWQLSAQNERRLAICDFTHNEHEILSYNLDYQTRVCLDAWRRSPQVACDCFFLTQNFLFPCITDAPDPFPWSCVDEETLPSWLKNADFVVFQLRDVANIHNSKSEAFVRQLLGSRPCEMLWNRNDSFKALDWIVVNRHRASVHVVQKNKNPLKLYGDCPGPLWHQNGYQHNVLCLLTQHLSAPGLAGIVLGLLHGQSCW